MNQAFSLLVTPSAHKKRREAERVRRGGRVIPSAAKVHSS
jgi:hypothetical protein